MPTISRVTTPYSAERIRMYKDAKQSTTVIHMFSLLDIHGTRISRIYMDFEDMEMGIKVGDEPTIAYKL